MTRTTRTVLALAGVALVGYLVVKAARDSYFQPRAQLLADIEARTATLQSRNRALDHAPGIAADLTSFANRTLGRDAESVDHMLRSRLNTIAQAINLEQAAVGTGTSTPRTTPAKKVFNGRTDAARAERDRPDFVEVEAWIDGQGTLAQAIELIDRIDAEPWIKKITAVRLTPRNNGERFGVNVKLTTLYLPGRAPDADALREFAYQESSLDRYAGLIELNPFRLPPPKPVEPPPVVVVQQEPPKPPPFPYGQWLLTGVAENVAGPEAWLRHRKNGETRRLAPGEGLHEAVFLAARGDTAEFELNGDRFVITLGDSLDKRSPIH